MKKKSKKKSGPRKVSKRASKKPVKKRALKKKAAAASRSTRKRPLKKAPARKKGPGKASAAKPKEALPGKLVGEITHYFPHVQAGVVKIKAHKLAVGDLIRVKGHTTDLTFTILNLEIDHDRVQKAARGSEAGVQVPDRVREGDQVYLLSGA